MQSRLREIYEKQIVPELVKEFGYTSVYFLFRGFAARRLATFCR